jgi:hypothetical protein
LIKLTGFGFKNVFGHSNLLLTERSL